MVRIGKKRTAVQPGVKFHYTHYPESSFIRGLFTHTSVTNDPTLTAGDAVRKLGLKRIPDKIIPILDKGHFRPNNPPIVRPHVNGPGGGRDFTNDKVVPSGDVLPAIPLVQPRP